MEIAIDMGQDELLSMARKRILMFRRLILRGRRAREIRILHRKNQSNLSGRVGNLRQHKLNKYVYKYM